MFSISIGPEKLADLHTALNRALNTWEDAPAWLVELCDSIEKRNPTKLVEQITERLATLPTLDTSSFELRPYQRTAMAVGTEVHESVVPGPDQYLEDPLAEHLPGWAESHISPHLDGYAKLRAQLCTRDGRRMGNAVIAEIALRGNNGMPLYTVVTDMGNTIKMSHAEMVDAFYPPQYVMKPEAVGVRLKACVNEDEALEMNAAKATLLRMNYEWRGGELWAPPIGNVPWSEVSHLDRANSYLVALKAAIKHEAPNRDAMVDAVEATVHLIREAQKVVPTPPADPLDTPLPCDITVGHGTHKKGVKLRSLVTRMQGLYDISRDVGELTYAITEMAEQVSRGRLFVSKIDVLSMTRVQFVAYIDNLKREYRMRAEAVFAKR